jgi:[ribosomal protein S5]-alanine N-acetyltransferase
MLELQRLRPDHEAALLDFERANRAYFAESISDRGDDFFDQFAQRYRALLTEQQAGVGVFHVLVDQHQAVVGRFNLYNIVDGTAEVGYRVAQLASGRGVATSGLLKLCRLAGGEYGLRTLRATASQENVASQRVLAKAGFTAIGPADVGGRQGSRYELALATP